ncbi:MAG TPA: cytochrome c3 family protein [Candidatus Desulfovibrio intestinipullorum]|uniref:Cytochrome c3 family protein n=1 Tax=Candidatus Desulfovibrio intestinipullorum TaxID=2838536 RepID=A0A9D1PYW2_9BACT|nr:cytochrome c3 family protein [Candidatus Desulfovibrio intestinipullorum]
MKKLFLILAAVSFLVAGTMQTDAQAAADTATDPVKEIAQGMRKPIVLKSGVSPLLNVTFNHRTHMNVPCRTCHHAEGSTGYYVSCNECHQIEDARSTEVESRFQAFHAKGTDRSCYGCHTRMAEARPQDFPHFTNCRPCHMSDEARAAARAAARK